MRDLASGSKDKDYAKYKKLLQKKFVFLNVYCRSVKEEHDPRGPEGPYQFKDRSVPVLVLKRWNGETLLQQLGFYNDPKVGRRTLAGFIDKAIKKNGPVQPPKALRPLLKAQAKGLEHLKKKRISAAIREFLAVLKGAANKKKFEEEPTVAGKAREQITALRKAAMEQLDKIVARAEADPKAARKEIGKVSRNYGGIPEVRKRIKAELKKIPK